MKRLERPKEQDDKIINEKKIKNCKLHIFHDMAFLLLYLLLVLNH